MICKWCGGPFSVNRGGLPKQFCGDPCRRAFDNAARSWIATAVAGGALSIDELRTGDFSRLRAIPHDVTARNVTDQESQAATYAAPLIETPDTATDCGIPGNDVGSIPEPESDDDDAPTLDADAINDLLEKMARIQARLEHLDSAGR